MMIDRFAVVKVAAVFLCIVLFGASHSICAAIPESYNIDIRMPNKAEKTVIPKHLIAKGKERDAGISVAELSDERQVADKKVIGHVKEIGDIKVPVYPKQVTVTRVLAEGIRDYLKKAGYNVAETIPQWDLQEKGIPKGSGKVIVGGSIEELEVTCWTGVFSNDYKINVKLTLVVADSAKGKILYKGSVAVAYSKTDVSFSEEQLGREAGLALADTVNKLFEGKTVAQKIKKAIAK